MPFISNRPTLTEKAQSRNKAVRTQANWFEATLCGILTYLEAQPIDGLFDDILDNLDYDEMGVTRGEIKGWWREHKRQDEARRQREAEQARQEQLRHSALAKLTDEEKAALGIT